MTEGDEKNRIKNNEVISVRNFQRSKKWDSIKNMPPLYHKLPDQKFELNKSEVLDWLASQREVIDWIFHNAKNRGYIVFNQATGQWQGADYDD